MIQIMILDIILIMQYDIIFGRNNVCWGFTNNWDCNMSCSMNVISRITTKMVPETTSNDATWKNTFTLDKRTWHNIFCSEGIIISNNIVYLFCYISYNRVRLQNNEPFGCSWQAISGYRCWCPWRKRCRWRGRWRSGMSKIYLFTY